MGKSTEPPTCRFCGKAHRGTCMDHEAKGAIASQAVMKQQRIEKANEVLATVKPKAKSGRGPQPAPAKADSGATPREKSGSTPAPISNPRAKATRAKPSRQAQSAGTDGVVSRPSRRGGSLASTLSAPHPVGSASAKAEGGGSIPPADAKSVTKKRKPRMTQPTDKHANSDPMNGPVTKTGRGRPKTKTPEERKAYLAQKAKERRAKQKANQP